MPLIGYPMFLHDVERPVEVGRSRYDPAGNLPEEAQQVRQTNNRPPVDPHPPAAEGQRELAERDEALACDATAERWWSALTRGQRHRTFASIR